MNKTLVVLTGPTGVGKTELSLSLAEHLGSPILNADSRQIYRELPIGTAAPTAAEQARVPHLFVGTHSITQPYSAGQFERDALDALERLFRTHDTLLMVGGAMLYIDAVCHGLDNIPSVPDELRDQLRLLYKQNGLTWLQEQVRLADPAYFATADTNNPQRLLHALEVSLHTHQPYSSFLNSPPKVGGEETTRFVASSSSAAGAGSTRTQNQPEGGGSMSNLQIYKFTNLQIEARPFRILKIALTRPRPALYARINARVDHMLQQGLLDEARAVMPLQHHNALNTVGYKELFPYFDGDTTLSQAADMIRQNSRHYAKRQLTWFRHDPDIRWLNLTDTTHDLTQLLQLIQDNT